IWTFLNLIVQLPKGITHSYNIKIVQTRRRWKDLPNGFLIISRTTSNSTLARSYGRLKMTTTHFSNLDKFSRFFLFFPTISNFRF
ncbi:hypothetical protein MTR67_012220, partial [Solanum verrucosum]